MPVILGVWGFAMFLWTKIMFEALSWNGITVLGALLIAIVFAGYVFVFSGVMAKLFLPINIFPGTVHADPLSMVGKSIIPFVIGVALFGLASRLIILGFSEQLSRDLNRWFNWRGEPTEAAVGFAIITGLPCLAHYVMCLVTTYGNRKREE